MKEHQRQGAANTFPLDDPALKLDPRKGCLRLAFKNWTDGGSIGYMLKLALIITIMEDYQSTSAGGDVFPIVIV